MCNGIMCSVSLQLFVSAYLQRLPELCEHLAQVGLLQRFVAQRTDLAGNDTQSPGALLQSATCYRCVRCPVRKMVLW